MTTSDTISGFPVYFYFDKKKKRFTLQFYTSHLVLCPEIENKEFPLYTQMLHFGVSFEVCNCDSWLSEVI